MARRKRVGVVFGGRSGEHEVSLVSAASVIGALDRSRYTVIPIGITKEGAWTSSPDVLDLLRRGRVPRSAPHAMVLPDPRKSAGLRLDVVFPLVHGTHGEDGTLQGLLELADIPYVGSGVAGSALGMDKVLQKRLFVEAGLPIPKYRWYHSSRCRTDRSSIIREVEKSLRYPLFVKPANTGSSVGISKAHTRAELQDAIRMACRYDRKIVVEQGVNNAREIEVAVLGNDTPETSVAGEVIPSNEFYDYNAKYVDGASRVIVPAELHATLKAGVRKIASRAFTALDCCGMARVDFLLTPGKKIYLNEVNTIPGFTSISMYPKLWEASGLPYPRLLDRLISLAISRHREKQVTSHRYKPGKEWYR
ncbi:MAG: D-alanine--D-alanine ligase [Ignavibacteria bacterium]|nr:D-alanine--D-alanine ligase [Ignavibacteria bacterium]